MNQSRRGFLDGLVAVSALAAGARMLKASSTVEAEDHAGRLATALLSNNRTKRLAWFSISTDLLRDLVGRDRVYTLSSDIGDYDYGWLHSALLLPVNCRIDSVSIHHCWDKDQVSVRVEGPEFCEVVAGQTIEQVDPEYRRTEDGKAEFAGWAGLNRKRTTWTHV